MIEHKNVAFATFYYGFYKPGQIVVIKFLPQITNSMERNITNSLGLLAALLA